MSSDAAFQILEIGRISRVGRCLDATVHVDCPREARTYAVRVHYDPLTGEHPLVRAEYTWGNDSLVRAIGDAEDLRRRELEQLCSGWPDLDEAVRDAFEELLDAENHDYGCRCCVCTRERMALRAREFAEMRREGQLRLRLVGLPDEED